MEQIACPQCSETVNVLTSVALITISVEAADRYHARRFVLIDRAWPVHRCEIADVEIDLRGADEPARGQRHRAPGNAASSTGR